MATWPAQLPQKLPRNLDEERVDGRDSFPPDAGPAITVRRFSATSQVLEIEMPLTLAQEATLETFVTTTTKGGSLEFDWANCVGSNGLKHFTFVRLPRYRWRGRVRVALFSLRTRPGVRV